MDRQDRLEELKKLGNIHGHTTSSESVFSKWQGRVSALLSHDPIAQRKFEHYCDFILDDHEFGRGLISHETVEAKKKIHALVERVIADLEINKPDVSISIPDPVIIPDAAGFGLSEIEITPDANSISLTAKPIVTEYNFPLPAERDIPKMLTKDHGLFWLLMHGHWMVRVKAVLFLLAIFGFGVQSAQNHVFMQVWTWMITPITEVMKLLSK